MCQWIRSALVQIMACQWFDTKPLSKPALHYCQLVPYEQTFILFKIQNFSFKKMHLKMSAEMPVIMSRRRWVKWINDDPVPLCIYASSGISVFKGIVIILLWRKLFHLLKVRFPLIRCWYSIVYLIRTTWKKAIIFLKTVLLGQRFEPEIT